MPPVRPIEIYRSQKSDDRQIPLEFQKYTKNTSYLRDLRKAEVLAERMALRSARDLTETLDFGGFDSSMISMSRGGIPISVGSLPEVLSRRVLAGTILAGRSGAEPVITILYFITISFILLLSILLMLLSLLLSLLLVRSG